MKLFGDGFLGVHPNLFITITVKMPIIEMVFWEFI
jgi:hypothetical protein